MYRRDFLHESMMTKGCDNGGPVRRADCRFLRTSVPPVNDEEVEYGEFPLKTYLGMEVVGDEPGRGIVTIDVGPEHLNPNGVVHGAVLSAMIDTAMGKATMSMLPDGQYCSTVEFSLRFIRPASSGTLTGTATVVKQGRNLVHLQASVVEGDDRLIATAAGTFAIITF
jgi:uncharacterized protein (TIGR00369 family)